MAGTYNNTQVLEATGNKSEASTMSLSSVSSNSSCSQSLGDNDLFVSLRKADSCATYNPTALYDQTMTLESCFAGSSLKSNKSQTFTYNQSTGKLTPVSCVGGDTSQKANSLPSSMDNSSNSTSTSSSSLPQTTSSSQRRRDSSAASSAQNVTLVFVPNATSQVPSTAARTPLFLAQMWQLPPYWLHLHHQA
ncbi:hypothetical protein CPB83DRAFT_853469 [Crepidotus variabilis]|uniref:Uncharacterized protein n=1 Tax=Crepidotus variabilis TaxID=179855 RepID=A0A9P6EG54_9AGAR|nr:hypothetical protein CPB83DRAFT_853469 [Crepidotus variabilis]